MSFSRNFFNHEEHEEHKEKYLKDEINALCDLRGLFTCLIILPIRNSRYAPTGLYGSGLSLNDKPGIVQIRFIIDQRF